MIINEDCTVKFVFRDGTELPWMIDPGVKAYKKRKTVGSCHDKTQQQELGSSNVP